MPMIDVYTPSHLIPEGSEADLIQELTYAVLRAEGITTPGPFHQHNTAVFIHRLSSECIGTHAKHPMPAVRVQIVTPPGALNRAGQQQITQEATDLIAKAVGSETMNFQTWVILMEAAEGGWGIAGTAYGIEEFAALAHKPAYEGDHS